MTSARSGKESPIAPNARRKHQESEQDCNPSDHLAPLVCGAGEVELDAPRSGRELNPYEGVISAADGGIFSVNSGLPAGIVILRHDERCSVRCRRTQIYP